ncbi:heterogeneous nuclear ribonucleoprotein H-like [Watersipora subatra]|uniref:heterogeneous nuclear ribonucleoprotein H-like n=1 Tax=Watersipora subatra TaxID=2589382 RepID=UPI00355B988F
MQRCLSAISHSAFPVWPFKPSCCHKISRNWPLCNLLRQNFTSCSDFETAHYVQLTRLDFKVTEQHVVDFLKDLRIVGGSEGITLTLSPSALRTGKAFVNLEAADDVENALLLDGETLLNMAVGVMRSSKTELNNSQHAMEAVRSKTGHSVTVVTVPKSANEESIAEFFFPIKPASIQFRTGKGVSNGKKWETRKAFVDFSSHTEALEAMKFHKSKALGRGRASLLLLSYPGVCSCYP